MTEVDRADLERLVERLLAGEQSVAAAEAKAKYLTTAELSTRTRTPIETLRYWRHLGTKGPRSVKYGRRVLYPIEDVEAWERGARDGVSVA
jgi:hypothetical protein